ncbi:AMP-binding protein [Massilia sp. IC2-477]|uniref:AMP-binding enzyme n=1 Tax=Massilia sp. IC2-477 TaxID=2887198 RepID=UPI001D127721|nr:AMP-binding protein [Massilia sp. IC2-477]MCC2955413.1 AMP-binding protein [Massilia sp. IC2-477]
MTAPGHRWWTHRPTLLRVLSDLLAGELASMRPGVQRRPLPWPPELDLTAELGADSLELLGLATAMEQVLGIGCIGEERVLAAPRLDAWLEAAASGLEQGTGVMRFRTSGSSGAPKTCTHLLADLWQESGELAALFPGTRRIVGLVPAHHIYGFLFTVLLPRVLGLEAGAVLDLRGASPGAVARSLQAGDLVVGFPDFWRAFAPVAQSSLPQGVTGVSSTAPCPDEVARAVTGAGVARLVQVYGSSETAGVGWRDGPERDYQLFPYWEASADPSVLTRLRRDGSRADFPLQDKLAWSAPGRFRPAGRIDHAVQVGGVNVFPAYVADVLRMHPHVNDATVRAMRPDEGQRLKAFVVPRPGAQAASLRAELDAWIAERLSTPERPAAWTFGSALPRQASGKLADWIIDTDD